MKNNPTIQEVSEEKFREIQRCLNERTLGSNLSLHMATPRYVKGQRLWSAEFAGSDTSPEYQVDVTVNGPEENGKLPCQVELTFCNRRQMIEIELN